MKFAVGLLWIACLAAFALPETSTWGSIGRRLAVALLAVHAIECLVFLPRLRRAGGSLGAHLAQTLVFGVAHVRTLPA